MSETADPFHFSTFIAATMEVRYLAGTDFSIDKMHVLAGHPTKGK